MNDFSFSYDHELKIQKARENARRAEKEKEAERYETLMHDHLVRFSLQTTRTTSCSRIKQWLKNVVKVNFDENLINYIILDNCTMHYKRKIMNCKSSIIFLLLNFSFCRQMADVQKRRLELLNEIKRKDRRTQHFVKDKQEAANLVREKNNIFLSFRFIYKSSREQSLNHRKILVHIFEKPRKISMKKQKKQN